MTKVTQTALTYDGADFLLEQWDGTSRIILPTCDTGKALAEKLRDLMGSTFREAAHETNDGKHIQIEITERTAPRERVGVKHAIATPKLVLEALEQWVVGHYVDKVTESVPHSAVIGKKEWLTAVPEGLPPEQVAAAREAWSFMDYLRGSVRNPSRFGHTHAAHGGLEGISHQAREKTQFIGDTKSDNRKIHEFALRLKLERNVGTITRS